MLFQFEAVDAMGREIKDVIEAPNEEEAQAKIRQMGYFVTMIRRKKQPKDEFLLTPTEESAFPRQRKSKAILALTAFIVNENIGILIAFIVGLMIGLLF